MWLFSLKILSAMNILYLLLALGYKVNFFIVPVERLRRYQLRNGESVP